MPGSSAVFNRSTNPTNPTLTDREEMTAQLKIVGEHADYLAAVGLDKYNKMKIGDGNDGQDITKVIKSKINITPV